MTEPDPALLHSMAMRYRHDFGLDRHPDDPMGAGCTPEEREVILRTMRQLWEEVVGLGFYKPPKTAEVYNLSRGIDTRDLNATVTLQNILRDVELEGFVMAGYTADGEEFFSSTYADGPTALWLLERCKKQLLEAGDS